MEMYNTDWGTVEVDLGFGEDGSYSEDDIRTAGWHEVWSNVPDKGSNSDVEIKVRQCDGRTGLLVTVMISMETGFDMWAEHWGQVAKVIREMEPLTNRHMHERVRGDGDPTMEARLLEQVERTAHGVWELSNDFDQAMAALLGYAGQSGLLSDLIDGIKEGLGCVTAGVEGVASSIGN